MNKTYITIAAGVIVIIAGSLWYFSTPNTAGVTQTEITQATTSPTYSSYQYECDEHVMFTMMPMPDASSIMVAPVGGAYPATSTLVQVATTSGVLYKGNGIVFAAHGETVTLGEGDSAITCSPVPDQNNAPFNFGD
ncbi:MAG: hypothetical protein JWO50_816 [Candidatus Kaiserbacteria bacterium]|nr:hypothetical protein [Candidatus Kaiserbacteria bacterium]